MAKRETNEERRAREFERRNTLAMASLVARVVTSRRENKPDLDPEDVEYEDEIRRFLQHPAILGGQLGDDVFLGKTFCFFPKNPAKFLRLVADMIDGKTQYRGLIGPGDGWHDRAIHEAYFKAVSRHRFVEFAQPSFAEFLVEFLGQNPKSKLPCPPSERSLRRALQRMGYPTRTDKRGRPKKK